MAKAQKRGMGKMREWTVQPRDKNTDRHVSRYCQLVWEGVGGTQGPLDMPHADISNPRKAL